MVIFPNYIFPRITRFIQDLQDLDNNLVEITRFQSWMHYYLSLKIS